jgi:hypothetical protein
MPGGVVWMTDENIPLFGTSEQIQIIVSAPAVALVLCGPPVVSVMPQTIAQNLEVLVNLRSYVAVVARHASGTASFAGARYLKSLV